MEQAVRVFVAGASGALGVPLVRQLVAQGHQVTGLTRHAAKRTLLEGLGAEAVVANALDPDALRAAVVAAQPDVVVHALTAIPRRGPLRARDIRATDRLRVEGTSNLLASSVAAGARRLVAESMVLVYGFGDHGAEFLTEQHPAAERSPTSWLQQSVDALRELERQVLQATARGEIEGIVLRFGFFYGPVPGMETMVRLLRRRFVGVPGGVSGIGSWVHVEDAAAAVVAAIRHGRPGQVYNVVDDEPVGAGELLAALASEVEAPAPRLVPRWLVRLAAPFLLADLETVIRVSNAKAKHELNWRPAFPTYRDGLADLAATLGREQRHKSSVRCRRWSNR